MEEFKYIPMDYNLKTPAERIEKVNEIIAHTPSERLTPYYLEKMADYLIDATLTKEEKKTKRILTDNHMVTVNKRETSFEGLADKLENGEDGIYNIMTNDKNILFSPKQEKITQQDLETIPGLKDLVDGIKVIEEQLKHAEGRDAAKLHNLLKSMRQDQYQLKGAYKPTAQRHYVNIIKSLPKLNLDGITTVDENGEIYCSEMVNLFNPKHISALLCNYSKLKEACWEDFDNDLKWLMEDLENLIDNNIKDKEPLYFDLIVYKIDGMSNAAIQEQLYLDYGIKHSVEYISSLWRNKIPNMLADAAAEDYLIWHFTVEEKGTWKKCSKCGQIKLAHNRFFSKNSASKDNFYSICKECRNKKNKGSE